MKFGLIGKKLSHSFSKTYFDYLFSELGLEGNSYSLFELSSLRNLSGFVFENELKGLNVTIPFKEKVISHLSDMSNSAFEIGAVNCIKVINKKLIGHNTDAPAFEQTLKSFIPNEPISALVLGNGGASKAVCFALRNSNIPYKVVARNPEENEINWSELDATLVKENKLIINCTPLGMFPNINEMPDLPYKNLTSNHYLYDLVYNPENTMFMKYGLKQKANVKNGLEMLHLQAVLSWQFWNEKD